MAFWDNIIQLKSSFFAILVPNTALRTCLGPCRFNKMKRLHWQRFLRFCSLHPLIFWHVCSFSLSWGFLFWLVQPCLNCTPFPAICSLRISYSLKKVKIFWVFLKVVFADNGVLSENDAALCFYCWWKRKSHPMEKSIFLWCNMALDMGTNWSW